MHVDVQGVMTNKTPNAPYRGAGRPETVFAMDRAVDCLARELRVDPADIRRRNYIRADELPWDLGMTYRDGNPLVYDSGDFPAALEAALSAAGYDAFRAEQPALRARGIYRGIGISGYVEGTAIGPFEGAHIKIDLAGHVHVATGAVNSGQGHETPSPVAADALGVPIGGSRSSAEHGGGPLRRGPFASRSGRHRRQLHRGRRAPVRASWSTRRRPAGGGGGSVEIEAGRVFVRGAPAPRWTSAASSARFPTSRGPARHAGFEAAPSSRAPVTYASACTWRRWT